MPPPPPARAIAPIPPPVRFGPAPQAEKLSMVRLLANPSASDKKLVATVGYLDLGLESEHFCLHKEDAENNILANCVWISVPDSPAVLTSASG